MMTESRQNKAAEEYVPRDFWLYPLIKRTLRILFRVFFRLKISGLDNVPSEGGVLLASNHQSFLDPMIVGASCRRTVQMMARASLFKFPGFGWLIRRCHSFPVHRGAADRAALRTAVRVLQDGHVVLVFPEGTRTSDGNILPIRSGPAMVAHHAGVPTVPVVLNGAFEAWPRTRRLFRFRRISIAFGEPLPAPVDGNRENYEEHCRELQRRLEAMLENERASR